MASKSTLSTPFFFIFDFYLMQGSTDDNDVLPQAILYFYPTDEQIKTQKLLDCGEIVGVVQYFQHDLFRSIPRTLHFQKTLVAHQYYGRHSAFLSVPYDLYTQEETHFHLKNILNIFNMLYGTWNHVHATYGKDNKMNEFLNEALTPIVHYVCNQPRSIPYLFSALEYTPLKKSMWGKRGNQRVLLECKHCLDHLKSVYGVRNGLIGFDRKILYSSYDSDTSFYLQLLFQLKKDLPKNLIRIPWESDFKLKNGVSLYRIYIRQPSHLPSISNTTDTSSPSEITIPPVTPSKIITPPINIFDGLSTASGEFSSLRNRLGNSELSPSVTDRKRLGVLILADQSGSSEETDFETDTMDESSSPSVANETRFSSLSISEHSPDIVTRKSYVESLTDEQKLENLRSRSSTLSNDMEKTIELDSRNNLTDVTDRIHITHIDAYDNSDDDDDDETIDDFHVIHRTTTVTSVVDVKKAEFFKSDRQDVRVSWTNIPDRNNEHEQDELVLYVQKNSRMLFAGVIQQSLLTDEYLKNLWNLMLTQMANMESEIQVVSTSNEIIRLGTDVKFLFNEHTRSAEFERVFDGPRIYRKIPSEESSYMALFARTELNRNPDRKVIGLSRGSHLISVDRRLPNRTIYSSRRFQEML